MFSSSFLFRRATTSASASSSNNITIRFVPPSIAQSTTSLGPDFGYQFFGKPSEIVWKPSSPSQQQQQQDSTTNKKASNPIDLYCGIGKKPNTETLMKSTFSAVRKARDMNRDKIGICVPELEQSKEQQQQGEMMKIKKLSDCTTTNMLKMFDSASSSSTSSSSSSDNNKLYLSEEELVEKLSLYSHLAAYEYNAKKTGAFLKKKQQTSNSKDDDDAAIENAANQEARDKLLNYKPQLSFWKNNGTTDITSDSSSSSLSPFVKTGKIIADNVNIARTWQNIRPDIGSPSFFAEDAIKSLGLTSSSSSDNTNVRIVDYIKGKQLQEKGCNLHYSVGKGASDANQPAMLVLEYNGNKKSNKATALVGKGVVMDTGGLNIKPFGNMETMHQDMGGAAAVFGAFKAAIELKLEQNIVCVLGFANNACSGDAYHPSEIITSLKGTTVEVLNTDAEGRLVLADCMTYVQKHADLNNAVDTVIDVATLTGAMCVALGDDRAGIFSNNATLCRRLVAASEESLEPLWPMPIGPEHHKKLQQGTLADMMNIGGGRYGGACTAAAFLQHFVEKHRDCLEFRGMLNKNEKEASSSSSNENEEEDENNNEMTMMNRWAHLDIAGPAMGGGKATDRNPPGSTGYGVSLLTEYFRKL